MWVGIKSRCQESPLTERRNYIFVTFISLSGMAQGSFAVRTVGFHRQWVRQKRLSLQASRDKLVCQSHLRGLLRVLRTGFSGWLRSAHYRSREARENHLVRWLCVSLLEVPSWTALCEEEHENVWHSQGQQGRFHISYNKITNVSWAQEAAESKVQFQNGLYTYGTHRSWI